MSILLVAGSPSERSRSAALLDSVSQRIASRAQARQQGSVSPGVIERLLLRDLSPQALLLGDAGHRTVAAAVDLVQRAQALVIATPVYKAAYSGVLKVFLDLLPQTAFKGKVILPIATGGSPHHMLALDYALRPVLQSLAARHILPGVYATDAQVTLMPEGGHHLTTDVALRLDDAVEALLRESPASAAAAAAQFASVPFAQVRCSV